MTLEQPYIERKVVPQDRELFIGFLSAAVIVVVSCSYRPLGYTSVLSIKSRHCLIATGTTNFEDSWYVSILTKCFENFSYCV